MNQCESLNICQRLYNNLIERGDSGGKLEFQLLVIISLYVDDFVLERDARKDYGRSALEFYRVSENLPESTELSMYANRLENIIEQYVVG